MISRVWRVNESCYDDHACFCSVLLLILHVSRDNHVDKKLIGAGGRECIKGMPGARQIFSVRKNTVCSIARTLFFYSIYMRQPGVVMFYPNRSWVISMRD